MYELWDVEGGNLIERFSSETEALLAVRELLEINGPAYADMLALGAARRMDKAAAGEWPPILEGAALLERARAIPA